MPRTSRNRRKVWTEVIDNFENGYGKMGVRAKIISAILLALLIIFGWVFAPLPWLSSKIEQRRNRRQETEPVSEA